jgi:hypothetical protein
MLYVWIGYGARLNMALAYLELGTWHWKKCQYKGVVNSGSLQEVIFKQQGIMTENLPVPRFQRSDMFQDCNTSQLGNHGHGHGHGVIILAMSSGLLFLMFENIDIDVAENAIIV